MESTEDSVLLDVNTLHPHHQRSRAENPPICFITRIRRAAISIILSEAQSLLASYPETELFRNGGHLRYSGQLRYSSSNPSVHTNDNFQMVENLNCQMAQTESMYNWQTVIS